MQTVLAEQPLEMPRILLVDDEPNVLTLMENQLTSRGFQPFRASRASEAMNVLRSGPPVRLVISDLQMPDVNGFEFVDHVREACGERAPAVMFMTGYPTCEVMQRAIRAGACDVLMKPFSRQELFVSLERALQREVLEQQVPVALSRLHSQLDSMRDELRKAAALMPWPAYPATGDHGARRDNNALVTTLKEMSRARTLRLDFFAREVCSGAPWSMMVDLVLARLKGRPEYPSSLSVGAGVPLSTALRYLSEMKALHLVVETRDETDARRRLIWCTDQAVESMSAYLTLAGDGNTAR